MDGLSKITHLPEDIVNLIFLKLSVKSLSRFKSCYKSWHCCIDDTDFIKSHLPKSSIDINQAFSCSGLIFVTSYDRGYHMTLFNPALGKYKLIPNSLLGQIKKTNYCSKSPIFGFAYDFVAEDYKVICQVSLNGVIHRMSHNRANYMIISFHLADEKFIVMPVPSTCGKMPTLHALGDDICIFTTVDEENLIWSLEKDRWICINKFPALLSLIEMPKWPVISNLKPYTVGSFLFVKENGNILWRKHGGGGSFIEYDLRKNKYTEFKSTQVPDFGKSKTLYVESYVESLVSLKIPWD
ncbi:hypothetical protein R3W88_004672 [Solanum pinnatisectum]|uniref:F-box domain-containing protein n=1 Tax=Solanum pinnatisectum TaxID=50273 RepID=A0AAV9KA05_9SOLN|nr:hypothetical protein R3W88_004672 [Solanum pinnatisectum]